MQRHTTRRAVLATALLAAAGAHKLAFSQQRPFRITAIPDESPTELARKVGGKPDSAHALLHQKKWSVPGLRYADGFWTITPPPAPPVPAAGPTAPAPGMKPLRGYMKNIVIREGSMDFLDIPSLAGGRRVPR